MNQQFQGWHVVATKLSEKAANEQRLSEITSDKAVRLNVGQRASLRALASRLPDNGVVIADEVGMGKTRIAVELTRCVIEAGGRVAILVPPGLGYQWQTELRDGGIQSPPALMRSLWAYFSAWQQDAEINVEPWFKKSLVMISHAFTNWRLGENSDSWRWGLLPEFCRLMTEHRTNKVTDDDEVRFAAKSIFEAVPSNPDHPARRLVNSIKSNIQWADCRNSKNFSSNGKLREWLERTVGLGLGVFDLVIIDEAHKSRGTYTGLNRLLENLLLTSGSSSRRVAMTATPVELSVQDWLQTLGRIGVTSAELGFELSDNDNPINLYAHAVKRLRQTWRSSVEARADFKLIASKFQNLLSPYLIRRDKREDSSVIAFQSHSKLSYNDYRLTQEISIGVEDLSHAWKQAVCAAESLSAVLSHTDDPIAKRMRLTMGNGHGIAALLDELAELNNSAATSVNAETASSATADERTKIPEDYKRRERAEWWLRVITESFAHSGDELLFNHPAISAAVEFIEKKAAGGHKVLVFGKFTRPLRALVALLNARSMLRSLKSGRPWSQSKVHGERTGNIENSEWPAVRAAHAQLKDELQLDALNEHNLDEQLAKQYDRLVLQRQAFKEGLLSSLRSGFAELGESEEAKRGMMALKALESSNTKPGYENDLALVSRALLELIAHSEGETSAQPSNSEIVHAFCELIRSASDRDDPDADQNDDGIVDDEEAVSSWEMLRDRLHEEYNRPEGGFARLMYGATSQPSRRMLQLAFNRQKSFPQVLVAQSMVGREGLNLHEACQTVVLLHPEWNPGVVEQQIGRIDRVGSKWSKDLQTAIDAGVTGSDLPRIEVCPVIFSGTYDEHNWEVLQERWRDLRAQLHGIVVSTDPSDVDEEGRRLIDEISAAAPNFSPLREN